MYEHIMEYESLDGVYYALNFEYSYNPEGYLELDGFDIIDENSGDSVKRPCYEFSNVPGVIEMWLEQEYSMNGYSYEEEYNDALLERRYGDRLDEE